MPKERYFLPVTLQTESEVHLTGDEQRHLALVMRQKAGEEVELVNGQGQLAKATLTSVSKTQATLHVDQVEVAESQHIKIVLAQALLKMDTLEWLFEKATELGVDEIILFPSLRAHKALLSENQRGRLNRILISALKQSGRLFLPSWKLAPPLHQWSSLQANARFFGDLRPTAPRLLDLLGTPYQEIIIFIGPESGLSPEELKALEKLQVTGVQLHKNILRAETAALLACGLLSQLKY